MAQRIHKQRNLGSSERDDGMYHDESNSLVSGGQSARVASDKAADTLSDIDDLLNDTSEGGFYSGGGSDSSNDISSTGGGTTEKTLTPGQMESAEASADSGAREEDDGLYKPGKSRGRLLGGNWRRRGVIGGLVGLALGGGIFGAIILSGPAMIIHYGQMLSHITPFQHQEDTSNGRAGKLIRWAKTGDIGETRIGYIGSKVKAKVLADFAKQGVSFTTDSVGQIKKIVIDLSADPNYKGMTIDEARASFAAENGISLDRVSKISGLGDGKIAAEIGDLKVEAKTSLLYKYVSDQGVGDVATFGRMRVLKHNFNLNGWLHPLKRGAAAIDRRTAASIRAKAASDEDSRLKKLIEKSDKLKAFNAEIRSKVSPGTLKTVGGALVATAAICVAKDIVHSVPEINRLNVVVPAMESAGDAMALSAQVMSNQDLDINQVGAVADNFKGADGTTPFQGQAAEAIAGDTKPDGTPVNQGVQQAFSPNSDEAAIDSALNSFGADALCSTLGQIVQGVAGLALVFTGAGGLVEKGVQLAGSAAVGFAIGELTSSITKIIADKPITGTPHQGAEGGNIDALGSVELSNTIARSQGGVELSPKEVSELDNRGMNEDFTSQSFASRMFNTQDYRSLASRVMDSQNPDVSRSFASAFSGAVGGFTNIGDVFSNLASALTPHVQAAPVTPYGLGIPESGMSLEEMNNPLVDNPYSNAATVASNILDPGNTAYTDRAKTCFGTTFQKDGNGLWEALGTDSTDPSSSDVNPASSEYKDAHCDDKSDPNWLRLRMFIYDNSQADSFGCQYLNDDTSCANEGFDASSTTDSSVSDTPTVSTAGYKNPLRDIKNLLPERIDGGVDYNGDPGPIYAVGPGKVIGVKSGSGSGWPGNPGAYIMYQLTDGPAKDKYVYMAEDCSPTVKAGDILTADTKICDYHYAGTAMEMGWSNGSYDYVTNDYRTQGGSYASNSGQDFSKFLVSLGAPPGKVEGSKSTVPMPAGWPTWQ